MFPDLAEIQRSVRGAWELFLNRPGYVRYFAFTEEAFWRSFSVFVLVLPLNLIAWRSLAARLEDAGSAPAGGSGLEFYLLSTAVAGVDWILYPVILALLGSTLGIGSKFTTYITARNWGAVILIGPYALICAMFLGGLVSSVFLEIATLIIVAVEIRYNIVIIRWTLNTDWPLTLGLAALAFLLTFALSILHGRLLGY